MSVQDLVVMPYQSVNISQLNVLITVASNAKMIECGLMWYLFSTCPLQL